MDYTIIFIFVILGCVIVCCGCIIKWLEDIEIRIGWIETAIRKKETSG